MYSPKVYYVIYVCTCPILDFVPGTLTDTRGIAFYTKYLCASSRKKYRAGPLERVLLAVYVSEYCSSSTNVVVSQVDASSLGGGFRVRIRSGARRNAARRDAAERGLRNEHQGHDGRLFPLRHRFLGLCGGLQGEHFSHQSRDPDRNVQTRAADTCRMRNGKRPAAESSRTRSALEESRAVQQQKAMAGASKELGCELPGSLGLDQSYI